LLFLQYWGLPSWRPSLENQRNQYRLIIDDFSGFL
jgi:hypothetical protein